MNNKLETRVMKHLNLGTLCASWLMAGYLSTAAADTYPSRTVRIVVPFAAGGGGDFIVRAWADKLSDVLKQSVIIDNRGGGNTAAGTDYVSKANPDGYTLLFTSTALSTNPTLLPNLPFKTPEDFAPIGLVITYPFGMAVRTTLEANSIPELIAYAKKNPGKLSAGTSGEGSASHLATELFKEATGVSIMTVPYRGAGLAMNDVAAGHVDMMFTGMSQIKPFVESKRVKVLASSGLKRLQSAPDVKTVAEQGVKGFNAVVWWGLLAPAGTPKEVVDKMNLALRTSLAHPDVAKRLDVIDGEIRISTPKEFETMIREEIVRWRKLLKPAATNP
jgi:tripartite-type tricarboxylate transporter receptor subunit TctC